MWLQNAWGPLVAWYLFLSGAGAGSYIIAVIAAHLGRDYRHIARAGVYLGAPLVALGALLLLMEFQYPTQVLLVFMNPLSSMMSMGSIIIVVFLVLGLIHLVAQYILKETAYGLLWLGRVNSLFALGIACYTGILLAVIRAIPFWNTPILPVLFLFSSLSAGIGAILLYMGIARWIKPMSSKRRSDVFNSARFLYCTCTPVSILEILTVFFLCYVMASSSGAAVESVRHLLSGDFSTIFLIGFVLIGFLVPLLFAFFFLRNGKKQSVARLLDNGVITGLCLLFGGVVLRFAILSAGMSEAIVL